MLAQSGDGTARASVTRVRTMLDVTSPHPAFAGLQDLVERGYPVPAVSTTVVEDDGTLHADACSQNPLVELQTPRLVPLLDVLNESWCDACLGDLEIQGFSPRTCRFDEWVSMCERLASGQEAAQELESRSVASLEEASALLDAWDTKLTVGHALASAGGLTSWHEEVERTRDLALSAFAARSREVVEPALLRHFAEQATRLPAHLERPEVRELTTPLRAQAAALTESLLASPQRALVSTNAMRSTNSSDLMLVDKYYSVAPDVLLAPLAVLSWLRARGGFSIIHEVLLLEPEVTSTELEAALVLFDPLGQGFATLEQSLEAARAF